MDPNTDKIMIWGAGAPSDHSGCPMFSGICFSLADDLLHTIDGTKLLLYPLPGAVGWDAPTLHLYCPDPSMCQLIPLPLQDNTFELLILRAK